MLERRADIYCNTLETDFYLDRTKPTYIGNFIEISSQRWPAPRKLRRSEVESVA
jgi:hypothetical protein